MRRPHRGIRTRLERRLVSLATRLPPRTRRLVRAAGERVLYGAILADPRHRQNWSRAESVQSFDAWAVMDDLASELVSTLAEAGVDVVRLQRGAARWLVVPAERREEALAALRRSPNAGLRWVDLDDRRTTRLSEVNPTLFKGDALSVYRLIKSPSGVPVGGPGSAVELQFWNTVTRKQPRPDGGTYAIGTRIAPRRDAAAKYLDPSLWADAQQDPQRLLAAGRIPALLDFTEPVDVVYTWVDDSDPEWRRRRASVQDDASSLSADALDPARTRNRDELRYSLRSIAMYAGWVRHIWLVTDGQVPAWLDRANPKLTVVSHREVFSDPGVLPTFNSHAIESQLHHIKGLAEHFLYFNDDVFIGRPVLPDLFFHGNGIAKFSVSPISIDGGTDSDAEARNGASLASLQDRRFLERTLGRTVTHRMQHSPHAHDRTALAGFEAEFPEVFTAVARSRFRGPMDVSVAAELGHYLGFAKGSASLGRVAFRYIDIGSANAAEHLESLLLLRDADCFCLNDVGAYAAPIDETRIATFLERFFPVPSPFETQAG